MLSTAARMAAKLAEAIKDPPLEQTVIADACGVTKQAVSGWLRTGRFDKKHLPTLARITGRPLTWWLDTSDGTEKSEQQAILATLQDWRMQASAHSQAVIDQLTALARKGALREEDWTLIEAVAQRLKQKS